MARRVETPDDTTVIRWRVEEGMSYKAMAQRWYEETNNLVNPKTFTVRCSRLGLTNPPATSPLLPWVVEMRHQHKNTIQVLRYERKRRAGEYVPARKLAQCEAWVAERLRKNVVIRYEPNSEKGFWEVPREWFDTDIVRDPDLVSLEGTKDPGPKKRAAVIAQARQRAANGF